MFDKNKYARTISLNAHYLVLFKYRRDAGQFAIFCETDVSDMLEICRRGVRGRYEHAVRLSTSGSKTRSRRTISYQNECFSRGDAARVCSQVKVLACWADSGWPFT